MAKFLFPLQKFRCMFITMGMLLFCNTLSWPALQRKRECGGGGGGGGGGLGGGELGITIKRGEGKCIGTRLILLLFLLLLLLLLLLLFLLLLLLSMHSTSPQTSGFFSLSPSLSLPLFCEIWQKAGGGFFCKGEEEAELLLLLPCLARKKREEERKNFF